MVNLTKWGNKRTTPDAIGLSVSGVRSPIHVHGRRGVHLLDVFLPSGSKLDAENTSNKSIEGSMIFRGRLDIHIIEEQKTLCG